MKKIIYIILLIIWCIVVFFFSNQNGEKSQKTSNLITKPIVNAIQNEKIKEEDVSFAVRKMAHFTIYFIGGILIFNLLLQYNIEKKKCIIISILFIILYATTDEIHQYFVSKRTAKIMDVGIDALGAILGIIINNITIKLIMQLKGNNKKI